MELRRRVALLKSAVWVLCLIPVGRILWRFIFDDGLGVNPVETLTHWSGHSALALLLLALAVTPLRRLSGWNDLQKVRRLVGLFAFAYVSLHLSVYIVLDQQFGWRYIGGDVAERPYIIAGTSAFALLTPLALTSTRGWIRRLGKRWQRLHRLVYPAAALAVLHFFWALKADFLWPAIAAVTLVALLALRLPGLRKAFRRGA